MGAPAGGRAVSTADVRAPEAVPPAAAPRVPCVAVCIATYRRPAGLARLLESLAALELAPGEARVHVVVVDNDADGSARAVVDDSPLPVTYAVEPGRNISLARNRGVALAREHGADWVAFVDDDETVQPGWLRELLKVAARYGADVVVGAIRPAWPVRMPAWLAQDVFYGTIVRPTGTPLTVANTGNVLVAARLLDPAAGPFDVRFGVTGGSDSHLFMGLHRAGARIVYAGEAVTHETIPESRARAGWVLRRAFRVGNTAMRCERALPGGRPAWRLARATLRLGYGAVSLVPGVVRGRAPVMRALWNLAYGCGACAGLVGLHYREYKRLHGG